MDIMSQIYAIIIFGAVVVLLPWGLNKWSDTKSGVRQVIAHNPVLGVPGPLRLCVLFELKIDISMVDTVQFNKSQLISLDSKKTQHLTLSKEKILNTISEQEKEKFKLIRLTRLMDLKGR